MNPKPEDFIIEDIAWHLNHHYRFGGAIEHNILQHSISVAWMCPGPYKLQALVHDSPEFLLNDVASPLKKLISGYSEIYELWEKAIFKQFDIEWPISDIVKQNDMIMLEAEFEVLVRGKQHKRMYEIYRYHPDIAYVDFLSLFEQLQQEKKERELKSKTLWNGK